MTFFKVFSIFLLFYNKENIRKIYENLQRKMVCLVFQSSPRQQLVHFRKFILPGFKKFKANLFLFTFLLSSDCNLWPRFVWNPKLTSDQIKNIFKSEIEDVNTVLDADRIIILWMKTIKLKARTV